MSTFTKEEMVSAFISGWLNGVNDPNSLEASGVTSKEDWFKWLDKHKSYRISLADLYIEETLYRRKKPSPCADFGRCNCTEDCQTGTKIGDC